MPTMSELIELAPWLAAVVIVVSVVVFITTKVVPVVRKFSRFLDDVLGAPPRLGMARRLSLMERVASIESVIVGTPASPGVTARPGLDARVALIEHEVTTNHGTSLKDAVKRTEERVTRVTGDVEKVRMNLHEHITESEPIRQQVNDLHAKYTKE